VFKTNAEFSIPAWLWLVNDLLESAEKWSGDPWSPFAVMWRRRAEALLAACPDAEPYLDEWRSSPARKHEGARPPDAGAGNDAMAVAAMARSADMDLNEDISILRRSYEHVETFTDPSAQVHVGDLPPVRESEWDPAPFKSLGPKAVMPIPDIRQSVFEEEARKERRAEARSRKPDQPKPHILFRPIGSLFGKEPVEPNDNKVFVVHGREHGPRDAIRVLLLGLGIEPIVLEDETIGGRTLIEKFEHYADVSYAVVVLTAEDSVTAAGGAVEMRPRQNVVLEFGYLMGRLGRGRVAIVRVDHPAGPSDVDGFAYITFDSGGGWKLKLARELKAAGFSVDLDRVK
jgi:hypothetical protein